MLLLLAFMHVFQKMNMNVCLFPSTDFCFLVESFKEDSSAKVLKVT